ncbi:uncharacterized protein LOC130781202 isoform X2 [Actinidia eriantha]|uniref:uncharacterized protein LOC130781202 isoform X2 n=1 Tax=Actinidia eriantha TaxID=165200 RepID=UPI0025862D3F|nr:uncharacterized protein LOC130781202 isoform X2 [Actinidia eriantha]
MPVFLRVNTSSSIVTVLADPFVASISKGSADGTASRANHTIRGGTYGRNRENKGNLQLKNSEESMQVIVTYWEPHEIFGGEFDCPTCAINHVSAPVLNGVPFVGYGIGLSD